jgi:hypothetical protein
MTQMTLHSFATPVFAAASTAMMIFVSSGSFA